MKTFHVTGTCIPEKNYMVDITGKLNQIIRMIDNGDYFTINRARQYGKTTTFSMLYRCLKDRYLVLRLTFEGLGDSSFSSERAFVETFINLIAEFGDWVELPSDMIREWRDLSLLQEDAQKDPFEYLSRKITRLCRTCGQGVILMIDEVDKSSDNQIFLNFLGMLRNKYLKSREGLDLTFQSVILAGVYDIKNLKLKLRPEEEKKYNSPWNVAADFNVDMSFSPIEIQTMLAEYEEDYHTGMDMEAISRELYFYTGGYPFLVSRLCKWVDEEGHKLWTVENIKKAENELLHTPCTLFDDLIKNYENNPELQKMIDSILAEGTEYAFVMTDPVISQGMMFGIFKKKENMVAISNVIFETLLYNHVMSKKSREKRIFTGERSQFLENGELNMPQILTKFQEIMKSEYREEDEKFIEQQGRLLFLCFLKPIINGSGFYYVEPETRSNTRMDLVVAYGKKEYIIELKVWHGKQYRADGIKQLEKYMDARNAKTGYLVSFSFLKNKQDVCGWIDNTETKKNIFEVVI